jgi:molybdopterin-dependent oxidoreductase alpha subunit
MEEQQPGSALDRAFVAEHTHGLAELRQHIRDQHWETLEQSSGVSKERMLEFAWLLAGANSGVFVWSMGLTQHRFGTDNVSQVANLALLRGFIGRKQCGVMPIRGHSGVQGTGEMGAEPMSLPGGVPLTDESISHFEKLWGFDIPKWKGSIAGEALENANLADDHERKLKLFYTSGGNFLETMTDPEFVRQCLQNVDLRVHQDIIFNTSTLVDAREEVLVLPAMTRYEQQGGGTSTSTERMVYFSPEIKGPRIEEARSEWEIYVDLAARVYPEKKQLIHFENAQQIRQEIARANPNYDGIQHLSKRHDVFQWGGAWLCEGGVFPTDDGKGHLLPITLPELRKAEGEFYVTTRRGKQFNSMIYGTKDPMNAADRYNILINPADARRLSIADGEAIVVHNEHGVFHGQAKFAETKQGNIQVYWPEGNVLIPKGVYEPHAGIPEYNTKCKVEKEEMFTASKDARYVEKPVEDLETNVG